jgi:hypothetical protein
MNQQLTFLDFIDQIDEGNFAEYPVSAEDVGGELLPILSKGLYTNPLDAIREYVQNAVDAIATQVTIQITGNSVWILDDGFGMSPAELHESRHFGVSKKSISEHVGFRGIGIYSGFDLCNRLRITTKQENADRAYILEYDFGQMKSILENARTDPSRPIIPLLQLLSAHTHFSNQRGYPRDKSFTLVHLEDINDVHIRRLSNREELRDYVLRNLPIDFDLEFEYREQINAQLKHYVKGYNPVRVILRSDGMDDEVIAKPNIPNLGPPTMELVRNSRGQPIAFYWACLTNGSQRIGAENSEFSDFEGLIYKIKGFTIGDREKLKKLWGGKKILYSWYTGEVYVLDENVIPNTERDDFETNNAKRALEAALQGVISGDDESLYNIAKTSQEQRVAIRRIEEFSQTLASIEAEVTQQTHDPLEIYSQLDEIGRKLKRYQRQAPNNYVGKAESLLERVRSLRISLRNELDQGVSVSAQKKLKTAGSPFAQPSLFEQVAGEDHEEGQSGKSDEERNSGQPKPRLPTLLALFEEAGWELDEDCQKVVQIVHEALVGVLGGASKAYRDLLEDIEGRIGEELEEE